MFFMPSFLFSYSEARQGGLTSYAKAFHFWNYVFSVPLSCMEKARAVVYGYHDDHLTRLQAILLLQKLNKFGLVEGFKRTQSHFGKSTIEFVE
jgi:hypothetical protein